MTNKKETRNTKILASKILKSWLAAVNDLRIADEDIQKVMVNFDRDSDEVISPGDFAITFSNITVSSDCYGYYDLTESVSEKTTDWIQDDNGTLVLDLTPWCNHHNEGEGTSERGCLLSLFQHPDDPDALYKLETPIIADKKGGDGSEEIDFETFKFTRYDNIGDLKSEKARTAVNNMAKQAIDIIYSSEFATESAHGERNHIFNELLSEKNTRDLADIDMLIDYASNTDLTKSNQTYQAVRDIDLLTRKLEPLSLNVDLDSNTRMHQMISKNNGLAPIAIYTNIDVAEPKNSTICVKFKNSDTLTLNYADMITGLIADEDINKEVVVSVLFAANGGSKDVLVACFKQMVMTGQCEVDLNYIANKPENQALAPTSMANGNNHNTVNSKP